jgi:hypothetical protein
MDVATPKRFMTHSGIQHKSRATDLRITFERIKTKFYGILQKYHILNKTVWSRTLVVNLLFIIMNIIMYVKYL